MLVSSKEMLGIVLNIGALELTLVQLMPLAGDRLYL